jgi:hypothetical protein
VANYVQIANLTGALIGTESHITDPNDDRTLARTIKSVWDIERKATIRDGEWNFACSRAALPALANVNAYPYAYAFKRPDGCLRILEVLNASSRESYNLEGQNILASCTPPLMVRFLVDVENASLWDDAFAEAFAARLAWAIGERIAGSAYNVGNGWDFYQKMLSKAKGTDARENPPMVQEESGWITARFGYSSLGWRP